MFYQLERKLNLAQVEYLLWEETIIDNLSFKKKKSI
ncbi:hypothetical protein G3A_06380 [Bacillus sp. 17376]|nr:hypothetical protein G3A_06380 [Bacillus sp. 17376]